MRSRSGKRHPSSICIPVGDSLRKQTIPILNYCAQVDLLIVRHQFNCWGRVARQKSQKGLKGDGTRGGADDRQVI